MLKLQSIDGVLKLQSISVKNIGKAVQGIRIGNKFIAAAEEDILKALEQQFNQIVSSPQKIDQIISIINQIIGYVTGDKKDFKSAYQAMAGLESAIFGVTETVHTQLLTVLNSASAGQQTIYYTPDEADAIINQDKYYHRGTIQAYADEGKNKILSGHVQQIVGEHWMDMLNTVNTETGQGKKETYRKRIYKNRYDAQATGQILDAYMNHLAQQHADILYSITSKKLLEFNLKRTVIQEIGEDKFEQLLLESTNRTSWVSGGDVIIANLDGDIVVNIQLKSSLKHKEYVGKLTTKSLINTLNKIKTILTQDLTDAKQYAKLVYNLYHTSAVVQKAEAMAKSSIQDIMSPLNSVLT